MNVCLPNRPAAPRPNPPHSTWNDSLRIRIYEGCPVRVDTAFIIPGGKNRRIVFKDMPKDHLERHYIVDAVTGKVYTEFEHGGHDRSFFGVYRDGALPIGDE